jgi:CheY-like chemotaxis protein
MMVADEAPPETCAGRAKRVLLVEDEALIRFVTAEHLRSLGLDVLEAKNGDEALVAIGAFQVDLVITDVHMPGTTSGLDLARWIDAHRPALRLLLISALPPPADATLGCVDWPAIGKPYRLDLLEERVARALSAG